MTADGPASDPPPPNFVPVCAIGASAGGVGALQTLFRLLPDDLGLAYVVVVHLSPDHPSAMHEILGACTKMTVHQVRDGPKLRANCVYVIAPDSELVIEGDDVKARPFTDPRSRRAPIDMFFRSIAAGRGDGIAVVLTGAGSDGALGVRAIKEAGGIVMVQEPAEAGFPSMPQNAIATGVADVVAPLARLAERIAEAAHSKEAVRSLDQDGAANEVRRIVAFLRTRTGHDFSGYKRSTVLRRIQRRMQVCQIVSLPEYAQHLRTAPEEAKELLSDLLISVTMFFRDPEAFITLTHQVVRPLLEARGASETETEIRAWVVGCATGEEAYSVAILLLEEAERLKVSVPIQIFATDLDEGALATAREGRYPRSIEADVSVERLKRFFVDEGTHYRIDRRVRDLILFAMHSVVREPPFTRLDLITCRNVLIYLERALQRHVNSIFRYGLKTDGYLFLGTAETADASDNHFVVVDRDARIYRASPARPDFVPTLATPAAWSAGRPALTESRLATSRLDVGEVLGESHAAALEASAPPSALVDAEQGVLHLSPSAGRFILLSAGPLSGRLPSIVRPELRLDLKLALDRAFDDRQPSITRPIDVSMDGEKRRVSLHITPLPVGEGAAARAVVYFLDSGPGRVEDAEEHAPPPDELQHLHSELKVAQEAELAGRIRHESAVQELRASNEELQSLNEEYRSTAEELETSKEELQSINEELQTVNAELKSKLGIISAAHNDLQNLTASSEIGTLFLDLELRIRMFTPPVAELINVAEADVGRPITNFTHRLEQVDIAGDVRRVLRDLAPLESEVRTVDGRWFVIRIRPYQTVDGKVEGAVATFDDITERKAAEEVLAEELRNTVILQRLGERLVTEDNIQTIYADILTAAIEITRATAGTVQMLDAETEELVLLATRGFGQRTVDHFRRVDASSNTSCGLGLRTGARSYCNFEPAGTDVATRLHVEDGVLSAQSSPLVSRSGRPIGMVSTHWGELDHRPSDRELRFLDLLVRQAADLIEERRTEAALRANQERQTFLLTLSDALRPLTDPVEVQTAAMKMLAERLDVMRASYFELEDDSDSFHLTARFERDAPPIPERMRLSDFSPALGDAYRSGRTLAVPDTAIQGELVADTEAYAVIGVGAWAAVPLLRDGRLTAWIGVHSRTPREWSTADLQALNDVAERTWGAVERTRVEAALRESEQKYRTLFTSMGQAYIEVELIRDADGRAVDYRYLQLNPAYERLTGVPAETAIGRASLDVIPGLSSFWVETFEEAIRLNTPQRFDYDEKALGRWYQIFTYPGTGDRLTVLAEDITERKRAEATLRESEERLRQFGEASQDVLWIRDAETLQWTYLTAAFEQIYGLSREEALSGDNYRSWLDLILPEDRATANSNLERVRAGEHVNFEYRVRRPVDGEVRWLRNTDFPIRDGSGDVVLIGGIGHDMTPLKEVQRQLESLIAGIPQLVWRAVDGGRWTWASPQWAEYTGQVEPNSHGWGWLDAVHPGDRDRLKEIWTGAIERGEFHAEFRICHAGAHRYRWFQARATPVRDDAGAIIEWLGTSTDVDELRELQDRQKVLVAELQHRTRNLIGVVRSMSDKTARASADLPDFRRRFRDRLEALSRVQGLLSRLNEHDRVTFDELIQTELSAMNGGSERVTLDGPQGVRLRSSTVQTLAMGLHELATNAVKYGALGKPDGKLAITWRLEPADEKGKPWLHIDWRESGVDMPPPGAAPRGTGQGRELIEQALPYQLSARTSYTLGADGVHCTISIPASASTLEVEDA